MGRPLRSSAGIRKNAPAVRPRPWDRRYRVYRLPGGGRKSAAPGPEIPVTERVEVTTFPHNFGRIKAKYGFMQTPNVPEILALATERGIIAKPSETTYYLGRENLLPTGTKPLATWRKRLFIFMSRNARPATQFFGIPPNRVVELGAQIEL